MWSKVLTLYEAYIGTGMIAGLFLVALIYLFVTEKNKNTRIFLVYVPVLVLLFYFCPLFEKMIYAFMGDDIYYRLLWLVPVVPVIAYASVRIVMAVNGKKQIIVGVVLACLIMVCGQLVYKSPHFAKAENIYHVPQAVVDICDAITEGEENIVWAVFPIEQLQFVRQYCNEVYMPYGRDATLLQWPTKDVLYDMLNEPVLDVESIAKEAGGRGYTYIVISERKELKDPFEDYGYELFYETEGYLVYKNVK